MMKKIKSIVAIIMTAILMTVNCSCVLVSADSDYGIDELFSDLGNLLAIDRQLDSYGFSESQKDDIYALGILYGIGKAFEDYSNQQSSGTNQNNTESENSGEQKYDSDQENSSEETVQYIGSFTCNPDELTFDAARWTSENYGYEFYTPEDWKRMDNDHQDPSIDIISDTHIIFTNPNVSVIISPNGIFIPKNDEIIVGIDKTIVIPAKNFIASFRLLDAIVSYVLVIDFKILLYIVLISIACLFSITASSSRSLSSSYRVTIVPLYSFSKTNSLAFNDEVKYTSVFSIFSRSIKSLFLVDFFNTSTFASIS